MSAMSLAGKVVFNQVTTPDVYKGTEKYSLTIAFSSKAITSKGCRGIFYFYPT